MSIIGLDKTDFLEYTRQIFEKNGLSELFTDEAGEKFLCLTELMLAENEKYNLTAITEPKKIILNHYADCAVLAKRLPFGTSLCDVGCGAGFPTLPIAILRPDVKILALDATAKRTAYVKMATLELGLSSVAVLTGRAEDAGRDLKYREKFDTVTARAVANMRVLAELCLPLCRVGGQFIAMKGKEAEAELADAARAIPQLSGRICSVESISLSSPDEVHCHPLIVIEKLTRCQASYPRAYARILKKPL